MSTQHQWGYLPLKVREWTPHGGTSSNGLGLNGNSEYSLASVSPDHSHLAVFNSSKTFVSVYELKEGE